MRKYWNPSDDQDELENDIDLGWNDGYGEGEI